MSDQGQKTNGPRIRLELTCFDCHWCRSAQYQVHSQDGHNVYCDHPICGGEGQGRYIADTRWDTPAWCPLRTARVAEFLKAICADLESGVCSEAIKRMEAAAQPAT
jgi:hypothetical protein